VTGRAWALRAAPVLVTVLLLSGCGAVGPEAGRVRLIQAMRRWNAADLTSYTYQVRRLCFCLPEWIGPYEVRVVSGSVVAVVDSGDGEPIDPAVAEHFPSVDGLFAIVDEAIRDGAHRVDVSYDQTTGRPIRIDIDRREQTADDEVTYTSTDPEPLPSG